MAGVEAEAGAGTDGAGWLVDTVFDADADEWSVEDGAVLRRLFDVSMAAATSSGLII